MVLELRTDRGKPRRLRRERPSSRRSVSALPEAGAVRLRRNKVVTRRRKHSSSLMRLHHGRLFCCAPSLLFQLRFMAIEQAPGPGAGKERDIVPIIEIQHLTKTFGTGETAVHALEDINLSVEPGDIFGIIGLSGAGKSTLVRCINLLERPTSGRVVVNGQEMTGLTEKELRKARQSISMIFQSFNLLMQRTALGNVCFPLELAGWKKSDAVKRARELLKLVGLEDREKSYPVQLSGGQKQRVAIARALATNPKVLLCDEATSALDPTTTLSILSLLKELNQKLGVTVVVITHQMNVIEEICSHVAILDGGVIAEQGRVEEIFTNPQTEIGRELVYPGGVRIDQLPASRVIRIAFNGGSSYEPLIASLAIDCGVKVNILGADTRNIEGKAFGTMLLGLPQDPGEAARALNYIKSQPNITVEEVPGHD